MLIKAIGPPKNIMNDLRGSVFLGYISPKQLLDPGVDSFEDTQRMLLGGRLTRRDASSTLSGKDAGKFL